MIKVICINGAWYPETDYDRRLMEKCELECAGYLSFRLLSDHVASYGYLLVEGQTNCETAYDDICYGD
jgi:hypothetical protein